MQPDVRGHADRDSLPRLTLIESGANPKASRLRSADQTLELCLLETQRQVIRLEEIVHRLTSVAGRAGGAEPPASVVSLLAERNRRLRSEVDEFSRDSHTVLSSVRPGAVPISRNMER